MNIQQFGATIKQKYPAYKDTPDDVLGNLMLTKYPQYKSMVTGGTPSVDEQLKETQLQRNKIALQEEQASTTPSNISSYLQKPIQQTIAQRPSLEAAFEDVPDVQKQSPTIPPKAQSKSILQKGGDLLYGAAKFLAPQTVSQYETALSNFDPNLTKEQKLSNLKKVQEGTMKSGLELGSYLVPAGKGISGMAKMGAIMGGMRGASDGDGVLPDIGSIAKGAAGGAAGGAIIGVDFEVLLLLCVG